MDHTPQRTAFATGGAGTLSAPPLVLSDLIPGALVRDLLLVLGGASFVGLMAQISIHLSFTPVPITGQTLAVLLTSTALGWRRGAAAMALYAVAGVAGVPWFAGGHGGFASSEASFGFIVGFIVCAVVCGRLAEMGSDRNLLSSVGAMVVGEVIMYVIGVAWLAVDLHVGIGTAITLGFTPFWIGDAIKCALAAGLLPSAWKLLGGLSRRA